MINSTSEYNANEVRAFGANNEGRGVLKATLRVNENLSNPIRGS